MVASTLERQEPGQMQEFDIAVLMERVFKSDNIYLNPYRIDTNKELTDVLIVNDNFLIFIQAKDSPNTENILRRKTSRKRSTIQSHVEKAVAQLEGAIKYAQKEGGVAIRSSEGSERITLDDRQIIGILVVKELFDYDYRECSLPVFKIIAQLQVPIALLDFTDLNVITHYLDSPNSFVLNGIYQIVDEAIKLKQFPRPVWIKKNKIETF